MRELFTNGHAIDLAVAVFVVWGSMQRRNALPWPMLRAGLAQAVRLRRRWFAP